MTNVISKDAKRICRILSTTPISKNYYLAGGTGLALQINHRESDDLDFFRLHDGDIEHDHIIYNMTEYIDKNTKVNLMEKTQLDMVVANTKVTFLAYPFPPLYPLIDGKEIDSDIAGIKIAPVEEIALMKAYSMGRRISYKDYVDMYYMLVKGEIDLDFIVNKAEKKYNSYGNGMFSEKLFREQLAYTSDITDKNDTMSKVFDKKLTIEEIDGFLKKEALKQMKSKLEKYHGKNDPEKG